MKKTTQILLAAACVAVLLTATVVGVLAYLIDETEVVKNTFTVGKVEIDLDEAKVDENGKPVGTERNKGNNYHLIPGQTYTKDPTMTVKAGSEESYVRLIVTITKLAELKEVFGEDFLPQNYVTEWDSDIWKCVDVVEDTTKNTVAYEFRYYTTVDASDSTTDIKLEPLFTSFTLDGPSIDGNDLAMLSSGEGLKIDVVGHAIQRSMLETEEAAWAAFDTQIAASNP